jgi:prepilin-type N-terminal cleavage/methylation domain-containing protein
MLSKLRERVREEHGFSLIELMVVVLIVGLLASIALAIFTNQRGKGTDVQAKAGVQAAARAMEVCGQENDGRYDKPSSPCDRAALIQVERSLADFGALLDEPTLAADTYTVAVHSKRAPSEVTFSVEKMPDGTFDRQCTIGSQDKGGCPRPGGGAGPDW